MVLIELVYCRITGRTRDLPKVHHFIPLVPWSCKKIKGKKKVMPPSAPDGSKEQIKLVLDMSNEGPIFKMLDSILKGSSGEGNDALSKLLKSGIPGLENLFSGKDFKFEKMSDEDKKRFLDAVTGAEGKINSKAAAALIAAAASGGDPEIANKIIEKMMSGLGDEIDPAMMAALMATTALVAQGATNEEILHAMQRELSNTGLTSDEILAKTMVLQRAMAGDNSPAFINKTLKNALYVSNISTKDLAKTLLAEKVIYQSGGTPEDIAKCMLIQSLLSKLGLSNDLIINAMKALVRKDTSASAFEPRGKPSPISSLGDEGITQNDVLSVVKLLKALEQRKVRGMKDIISLIEEVGDNVKTETDVINLLEKLVLSGLVKLPDINRTLSIEQKFSSSGVSNVKDLSRSLLLQKIMSENGMTEYEISSAMSLILMIEGLVTSSEFDASISDADEKCLDLVLSIYEELIDPKIPPESIRLMRKAMKQRRGSVENVAETLMLALAADGESHESIARAMVKALKTTGASPEEISRTISQSLEKFGMSQDEIAQIIAQAVADSGASASDVAKALKHTFASAIKDDPANAAELVRYMAETLAASGATPEEIAKAMHETLLESLSAGNEKLLEVADSVARTMTDAGASAQDIAAALKMAMKAASGNVGSNIIQELAVTMAKAMISSNASVDETIQAIRESLEMAGCSPDEIAECLVVALASSGADPTKTAETIQEILSNAGFNEEEVQQKILEAMLESGTSVGDIAQTLAKQKLLSFIGKSPTDVSKSLLKLLRSGDKINKEAIQSTLKSGGLDPTSAGKALLFQKALKSLGLDSKTVVAFISLQKEMMNEGKSPKEIASLLEKLVGSSPAEKDVQKLIQDLSSIELSAEDIMSLSDLETEVNRSSKKSSKSPEQAMKDLIEISSKKNMSPSNLILIQKLVNRLGISLTDVAKLSAIQKDMYESGASPQDIALALSPALPGPEFIGEGLKDSLMKKMEACDVNDCVDLSDAVKGANMSTDLMSKIILIQSTIEAQIISPEKSSEEFCKLTQGVRANKEELSSIFKKILSQNGVSPETLKKLITFEKAIGLCGTESETIFALNDFVKTFAQNFGADEKSVEDTLRKLFFKEDVYKSIGKKVNDCLSSSESSKMSKSELSSLSQLFEKIKNPGFSSSSISIDSSNDLEAMLLIALQDHPLLGGSEKGLENLSQILFFRDLFSELSIEKSKEMGNGMRILNKIWKDGDPLSVFETLQEVIGNNLEPFDLKLLQKVISGQVMPSTSTLTQFSSSLTAKSKLNLNSADDEFMDQIFNSALNMASLSDDDISKAMLVQKVLSASGVSLRY
ncbi:uncharacterized protein [Lepeophtheirus salmonis]|uniref:uncharacterized protein n=1 Tax=Lepeophtheirus salmonis TaxID=72036 RepID=UPI003AF3D7DC